MNTPENRTLTINKIFDAPLQLVWDAWTKEEHLVKWWAPGGMDITVLKHEFNVGGEWKYSMPMGNGSDFISEGKYLEIVEFEKIVTTADFKPMTTNVEIHVAFEADGEQTKFTFSVVHETEEYCKQQEEMGFYNGWGGTLDRFTSALLSLK